jgi:hypothetical protein
MQRLAPLALALICAPAWGQVAPAREGAIYTCIDDQGTPLRRDRYIVECRHKEQRILNKDGSLRTVLPPTLTPDERAQREAAERASGEAKAAQNDAVKYDRLLLTRFRNEASHNKARASALDSARGAIQSAEARLRDLADERKRLLDEAEFYRGRPVPPALKQQLEANDVAVAAQRNATKNSQAEQERISAKFDAELIRLRKLWSGAEPGSLGPASQ